MKNLKAYERIGLTVILIAIFLSFPKPQSIAKYWMNTYTSFSFFTIPTPTNLDLTTTSANTIKVALLLDTSNSMDGLMEQAKSQLWKIIGELSNVQKGADSPSLEIALYDYGNDNNSILKGYVRQLTPFTTDMDLVSEKLFGMTTKGGNEYCGQAIHTSLTDLDWGNNENALQLIYIAGNEPFDQGNMSFEKSCGMAKQKGVMINTIFCGNRKEGLNSGWLKGAQITGGEFMNIDQDKATVYVTTPYDQDISQLNDQLNTTYVPYGAQGTTYSSNQRKQDANAATYSIANKAERAAFKSSKKYKNDKWDLVDAYEKDKKVLKKTKVLPKELAGKSEAEIASMIALKKAERTAIQAKIKQLNAQRKTYQKTQSKIKKDSTNLENSILLSIRKQAKKKGYKIEE